MRVSVVMFRVAGTTYKEIIEKSEDKLSSFLEIEKSLLENNVTYEYKMMETSDDGVSLPIVTAEVVAKVRDVR